MGANMSEFGDNMKMIGTSNSFGYLFFTFMVIKNLKACQLAPSLLRNFWVRQYRMNTYFSTVSKVKIFEKMSNFSL